MDFKIILCCLFIVACPCYSREYGKYVPYGALLFTTFAYFHDARNPEATVASQVSNMLRQILPKLPFKRWMSNAKSWMIRALQQCLSVALNIGIPAIIVIWGVSLFIPSGACYLLIYYISSWIWKYIKQKYAVNIHPWVILVVNWIYGLCDRFCKMIVYLIIGLCGIYCFGATLQGILSWLFVKAYIINVHLSKSMEVRNSTVNLRYMRNIDNFTHSNNNFVKFSCEFGILHADLSELNENFNMTQMERLEAGVWMSWIKSMKDAKHDVAMNRMELEFIVEFIKIWIHVLEPFKELIIYFPYLFGLYRFRVGIKWLITIIIIPFYTLLYVWFVWIRCWEQGFLWGIFHKYTCANGLMILVVNFLPGVLIWGMSKLKTGLQELVHAFSQPPATQTRSVRGKSPSRRNND